MAFRQAVADALWQGAFVTHQIFDECFDDPRRLGNVSCEGPVQRASSCYLPDFDWGSGDRHPTRRRLEMMKQLVVFI